MSESGRSDSRLPSIAANESKNLSGIAASLWGVASEKPWRTRLVGDLITRSVLSSKTADLEYLPRVLGGPPRNPKVSSEAVVLLPVLPESSRKLGRWPEKPNRKPIQPRMAHRRPQAALMDSMPSQASRPLPLRPPSPVTLAEAAYVRDQLGKDGGVCRGDAIDQELEGRNEELAEFARHRHGVTQATQEVSRRRAVQWRGRKEMKDGYAKIQWILSEELPRKPVPPDVEDEELDPECLHPKNVSFTEMMVGTDTLDRQDNFIFHPIPQRQVSISDDFEPEYTDLVPPPTPFLSSMAVPVPVPDETAEADTDTKMSNLTSSMKNLVVKSLLINAFKGGRNEDNKKNSSLRRKMKKARSRVMKDMKNLVVDIDIEMEAKQLHAEQHDVDEDEERMQQYFAEHSLDTDAKVLSDSLEAMAQISHKDSQSYRIVWRGFCGDGHLDQADLMPFIQASGFKPKNDIERKAVNAVLSEINTLEVDWPIAINTIIPEIRVALTKIRLPDMMSLFQSADADNSGSLSILELHQILRRGGYSPDMAKVVEGIVEHIPSANDTLRNMQGIYLIEKNIVTMQQFVRIAPILIERFQRDRVRRRLDIVLEFDISDDVQDIWGPGLVDLQDAYMKRLDSSGALMPVSLLHYVAVDVALLTRRGHGFREKLYKLAKHEIQQRFMEVMGRAPAESSEYDNAVLDFGQVLRILTNIRRQECDRIRRTFENTDNDNTNGLSLSECIDCLAALGTVAQSKREAKLIDDMMEEYDEDESGELDVEEFMGLVKFVADGLRKMRRSEIIDKANDIGYSEDDFDAMEDAFINADWNLDYACEESELQVALRTLRPKGDFAGKDVDILLQDMGLKRLGGGNGAKTKVGLWEFIQIARSVDLQKEHRDAGSKLGLDREAIDAFETIWNSLKPTKEGLISPKDLQKALKKMPSNAPKISRLKDFMDNGLEEVSFPNFLLVMRRGYEKPVKGTQRLPTQHTMTLKEDEPSRQTS